MELGFGKGNSNYDSLSGSESGDSGLSPTRLASVSPANIEPQAYNGSGFSGSSSGNNDLNLNEPEEFVLSAEEQALKDMDKGGYYGGLNGKGTDRSRVDNQGLEKAQALKLASANIKNKAKSTKKILEQKLKEQLRGIASIHQSSFDKNGPFIFHTMCRFFDDYERRHDIKLGTTQCPPK